MAKTWGDWYPTPELRFVNRLVDAALPPLEERILQQKWCRLRNQMTVDRTPVDEEWRDVPTE